MCDQYNGWTNRETWATKLHLDNTEILSDWAWELARKWNDANEELFVYELGEWIKDLFEDDLFAYENVINNRDLFNMLTDIGSFYRVNWQEIAQTYVEELAQEEANA